MFVRDRRSNQTRRLSVLPGGSQATADSYAASATGSGRFVTFISGEKLLVGNDDNFAPDQFLLDRDTDGDGVFDEAGATSIELASVNTANTTFSNGVRNVVAAVNEAGTSVTFATIQPLVGNDSNGASDVYVRERAAGSTRLQSQSTAGVAGNGDSPDFFRPPILMSDSGAIVAFSSSANNLDVGDAGSAADVFVRNRDSDGNGIFDETGGVSMTRVVPSAQGGVALPTGPFVQFGLSGDGRWLAIAAINAMGSNPSGADIYIRDLTVGTDMAVGFVSGQWAKGTPSCCGNQSPLIARNASVVAFTSTQLYVFDNVSSGRSDVFVKASGRSLVRITDYPVPASASEGYSFGAGALSRNGAYLLIGIVSAGPSPGPEEGYFVYQRDEIYPGNFD